MLIRKCSPLLSAALVAVALAACGSSSKTTTTSPSGSPTSSSASTTSSLKGAPVVLGTIGSFSGSEAGALGTAATVGSAWADWTNAHGGINGHPVKMIVKDDAANPATSLQDAKELVTQDHVMAIVGEMSIDDGSWASYVAAKGIPVIGGAPFEPSMLTNPDFYPSGTQLLVNQFSLAKIAKQGGGTHLGTIYCAEAATCASLVPLSQAAAKLYGLGFYSAKISATAPSYTAPCLAAKSAGVNALYVGDNAAVVQRFVDACAQQGFKPKVFNTGAGTSNAWLKDSVFQGTKVANFDAFTGGTSVPGVAEFVAAINKYSPGLTSSSQYNPNAIYPWAGGQLFAAAAKAAHIGPTSTSAELKKGLYALKGVTLDGVAPPLTFTPGKPAFITCYFATQIENGKYTALNSNKPYCLPPAEVKAIGAAAAAL